MRQTTIHQPDADATKTHLAAGMAIVLVFLVQPYTMVALSSSDTLGEALMRRVTIVPILAVLVILLAACAEADPPVIPTVAQLPSVTPAPPTAAVTAEPEATAASVEATSAPETTALEDFTTATPGDEETLAPAPVTPTPTPDRLPDEVTPSMVPEDDAGPETCSALALEDILLALDQDELSAAHEGYMARLRDGADALAGWTLVDEPDPLAGTTSADALPLGSLRYQRPDGEALVLVSAMIPEVEDYYTDCIAEEAFVRQGDISETATLMLDTLALGDQAVRVVVEEPALDEDGQPTGEQITITTLYLVLTQDALIQYSSIPALDEALGREPVSQDDAEALLAALVDAVESLAAGS